MGEVQGSGFWGVETEAVGHAGRVRSREQGTGNREQGLYFNLYYKKTQSDRSISSSDR
ncbi:hypothetical protein [Moorena producens]|uniref:hypothetical protein n=1 Tax=Moorena producens TaxID=1155739 RepID=UPI001314748C|nr:hypothetical protein [Moorena producens]